MLRDFSIDAFYAISIISCLDVTQTFAQEPGPARVFRVGALSFCYKLFNRRDSGSQTDYWRLKFRLFELAGIGNGQQP